MGRVDGEIRLSVLVEVAVIEQINKCTIIHSAKSHEAVWGRPDSFGRWKWRS